MNLRVAVWLVGIAMLSVGCQNGKSQATDVQEDKQAKKMLQGIWIDEDGEDVAFRMKGDTIYYPDSTSQPVYFYVASDTMVIKGVNEVKYAIVKLAPHLFEFKTSSGDVLKLVKTADKSYLKAFNRESSAVSLNQNKLVKRDSVIAYGSEKYHLYVQVNPTTYKVFRSSYNDDGVEVDNVYYDNIINLNVYKGGVRLFSRDFRKVDFSKKVPASFLEQAILSDISYGRMDKDGVHFVAVLAMPDSNLSYQVEMTVSFSGKLKIS